MPEALLLANTGANASAYVPESHRSTRLLEYLLTHTAEARLDERQIAALTKLYYHVQVDDAPADAFAAIVRLLSLDQFRNAVLRFAGNSTMPAIPAAPVAPIPAREPSSAAGKPAPARASPPGMFPFGNELLEQLFPWAVAAVVAVAGVASIVVLMFSLQELSRVQAAQRAAHLANAALVAQLSPRIDAVNAAFQQVEQRIGLLGERVNALDGDLQKQRAGVDDALARTSTAVDSLADAVKRTEIELPPPPPAPPPETGGGRKTGRPSAR